MAAEAKLEEYLDRRVKELGGYRRRVCWLGRRGANDDLVWFPKVSAFIELKAPGKTAEAHQAREHERLRTAFEVYVIDNKDDLDVLLTSLAERSRIATGG